jgi:TusA-related sulfurtransferase
MSNEILLDCQGMKCPRPIIELAKAARRNGPGTMLRVISDDLAFESDVNAWCDTGKGKLLSLEKQSQVATAVIELL